MLKDRGLSETSSCLEIGCGPLRAGVHIIRYLNVGGYVGIDFNPSFVEAAHEQIRRKGLQEKAPEVYLSSNAFRFIETSRKFDYAIAFSVLNHCDEQTKKQFFQTVPFLLEADGKLLISHASWLTEARVRDARLRILDVIDRNDYDITRFGWHAKEKADVFPIFELGKTQ